jgi:uncharacterized metal-binding protein
MVDLNLSEEEKKFPLTEREADARILGIHADTFVRCIMALAMIALFFYLNMKVIGLVQDAYNTDITLLNSKVIQSDHRLITEKVFMSLIGATVVQVGVTLVAITGYLFPKK